MEVSFVRGLNSVCLPIAHMRSLLHRVKQEGAIMQGYGKAEDSTPKHRDSVRTICYVWTTYPGVSK